MLTQKRLKELLHWNGSSFVWISGHRKFRVAGSEHKGYILIRVDRKAYLAHRLVWLWIYGDFPKFDLDHIDRNKKNNAIENLREVTNSQNHQNQNIRSNNTTGTTGIYFRHDCGKWRAMIKVNGKQIHLGYFEDKSFAIAARKKAEKIYHPFQS